MLNMPGPTQTLMLITLGHASTLMGERFGSPGAAGMGLNIDTSQRGVVSVYPDPYWWLQRPDVSIIM